MRISDWSSDVCSSDLAVRVALDEVRARYGNRIASVIHLAAYYDISGDPNPLYDKVTVQGTRRLIDGLQSFEVEQFVRSEEHTSELQSLMRISYAVFCLKKKKQKMIDEKHITQSKQIDNRD